MKQLATAIVILMSMTLICRAQQPQSKGPAPAAGPSSTTPPVTSPTETRRPESTAAQIGMQKPPPDRSDACCSSVAKIDDKWNGKDYAALLSGIAGMVGSFVAGIAVWRNGNTSRETNLQKANEAELEALETKLEFYGPYLQLSNTNRLIATELKSRRPDPEKMRILLIMLNPQWREGFSKGDIAQINEIISLDESLLKLIQNDSGLTGGAVQPYLWRAASHFRMMLLAHKGELDNDPLKYGSYVYPRQLDQVVQLEMRRIRERIELIRRSPMTLHPPMPDLQIPDRLKMDPWPGIPS